MSFKIVSVIFLFFLISAVFGQNADTVLVKTDSLSNMAISDSLSRSDSTKSKNEINSVIFASASDSVTISVSKKKMRIFGDGKLNYEKSKLTGGRINVNFNSNEIESFGIKDTSDTTGRKFIQTPVLSEGNDTYKGKRLRYNFKTKQGFISHAVNDSEKNSRYEGEKVKKIDEGTYYIENGMFTTCDSDTPHTHFTASRMKIVNKKLIIAEWIFMHIAQIPLPVPIPFGVFPMQSGRRSGIIIPQFTSDNSRGLIFRNFGYYWAINDYMDVKFTADYYTRGGYGIAGNFRYNKRYSYTGSAYIKYSDQFTGEKDDPDYNRQIDRSIMITHNQKINPTSDLNVSLRFQTANFNRNNTYNISNRGTQNISSNATYSKRWDGASLTASYSSTHDLIKDTKSETLPDVRFQKTRFYPFASATSDPSNKSWYEQIAVGYNSQYTRRKNSGEDDYKDGIKHNFTLSASPKAGYINISPTMNYTERWYSKYTKQDMVYDSTTSSYELEKTDVHGFNRVVDFSVGVSMSTKLYGMMNLNSFGIEAIRHTLTPSISYSYRPDFTNQEWGYYDTYIDSLDNVVEYNKYDSYIMGSPTNREQQSINFSVSNIWEMKTQKDPTDTTSKAQKIRLLSLTASTSYNLAADEFKLSDLRLSYRTQIGEYLNFSGSNSFTFYDQVGTTRINKFLINQGKGLMRMTNFSLNLSTNLSGDKLAGSDEHNHDDEEIETGNEFNNNFIDESYLIGGNTIRPDFSIPWNVGLNFTFNYNDNGVSISRRARLGFNGGFNLTKNWKFTFNGSYDLIEKEFQSPALTVHRSLHCWEMNFSWNPTGYFRSYNFEIRMTSPMFKDIKVEKSRGYYSGLR